MNKNEFLSSLRAKLRGIPQKEAEERLSFYREMIDDRMEEGLSESEAVKAVGSINDIARQITDEYAPIGELPCKEEKSKGRLGAGVIILLILGSPVWLSLMAALFAVVISVYAVIFSLAVSLWAIFASVVGCSVGGIVGGIILAVLGHGVTGLALVGAGIASCGIAIFGFYGCKAATHGAWLLSVLIAGGIKKCFIKGGEN